MTTALRAMPYPAKYIGELFREYDFDPRSAIPIDRLAAHRNIYAFSVAPHPTAVDDWWLLLGGTYDNYVGYGIQLFFNQFLILAASITNLLVTENSFFVDVETDTVFINIPLPPWMYFDAFSAMYTNEGSSFSTAPKNELNLSDIFYGTVRALPRMQIPSIQNKISDSISGVVVYNTFGMTIDNADGFFDDMDIIEYFNTPMRISKTTEAAETLQDFNVIRTGVVTDISVEFEQMRITGVDTFYQMGRSVCRRITAAEFPLADDNALGKEIPIAWGNIAGCDLIKVGFSSPNYYYIALDKSHLTSVSAVYDKDGTSIAFSVDYATGIISTTIEADTADVVGRADSRIGTIIIEALAEFENTPYLNGMYDVTETDAYIVMSPYLDFYISSGTTRDLVLSALKNDIAFLIQKNNGLLTLRRWGEQYDVFTVDSWLATQKPKKDFKDASKYYCTTCAVNYTGGTVVDDSREAELFERYRRSYTATLETTIRSQSDAEDLASRFMARFGDVKESLQVGLGVDTYNINLLDTLQYAPDVNGRAFSQYTQWIVKEADPGQDILRAEALA